MEKPALDTQNPRKPKEPRPPRAPRAEGESQSPTKETGHSKESPKRRHEPRQRNDDWKIDLEKTLTADSKVPQPPKEEELLKRPDQNNFKMAMEKTNKKIEKLFAEIEELKKQERDLREEIFAKNNAEFVELRKLGAQRKELASKLDGSKKAKEEIKAQIQVLEDKKSKLEKKGVNGRVLPKERLEEIIAEKEKEHKNSLKTAADEKRYLDEITRLKEAMPLINEINKIQVQIDALYKRQKEINATNKPILNELDGLRSKADALRAKLGLGDKKEEGEKTEEKDKKEKPKRELTQEEKDLQAKRQQLFEQIGRLKDSKNELYEKHQKEYEAFHQQQDEIYRIKFMNNVVKKLKEAEKRRKWEADKEKRQKEEVDRAKVKAAAKFNEDIEICESLAGEMEQIRFREKMREESFAGATETKKDFKVDDKSLKEANLVILKPKKDESEGVQPGQRKMGKKGKKTDTETQPAEAKLDIPSATLTSLAKMGIPAPANLAELDKVVETVRAKKEGLVRQRDEAIAKAEEQLKAEGEMKEAKEVADLEKQIEEESSPKKEESAPRKDVNFDERSFPALE